MEKPMKKPELPKTDSIQKLAEFWDTHSLTDFEDQLEEVTEPVFDLKKRITFDLPTSDAQAVSRLAESKGVTETELVREWVLERLHAT